MAEGRIRGFVQVIALLGTASLVALAGGEWVLRTWAPQAGFVYRLDSRCHYSLLPGSRKLYQNSERNGGRRVLFAVNSDGFRGEELRREPGTRVVVYGDSFVDAEYVPSSDTFPERLEARLAPAVGRSVEVVNAGVAGYGPDQALRRFEDEAGRLAPSLAVLALYAGNDFGDVLRNRIYRLEGGRIVAGGGFVSESLWWQFEDARRRTPWHLLRGLKRLRNAHRRARASAELRGQLARYVERSLEMCADDYQRVLVRGDRAVEDVFRDPYDADVALLPDSPAAVYKRDLLAAVLDRWRRASLAARVPVLVVVVPPAVDCDAFDVKVDRAAHPGYDPARLSRVAAEAAGQAELPVLELREPFLAAGAEGLYNRQEDDHWNARGQELAARLVAERVVGEGWLRPR